MLEIVDRITTKICNFFLLIIQIRKDFPIRWFRVWTWIFSAELCLLFFLVMFEMPLLQENTPKRGKQCTDSLLFWCSHKNLLFAKYIKLCFKYVTMKLSLFIQTNKFAWSRTRMNHIFDLYELYVLVFNLYSILIMFYDPACILWIILK